MALKLNGAYRQRLKNMAKNGASPEQLAKVSNAQKSSVLGNPPSVGGVHGAGSSSILPATVGSSASLPAVRSGAGGAKPASSAPIDPSYGSHSNWSTSGLFNKASAMGSAMWDTATKDPGLLKAMGKSSLKGAVAGGAIGGSMEAAQGGDFWSGAKSGAFDGAMMMGGYKGLRRAAGTDSMNPLAVGKQLKAQANLFSTDAKVSKQAWNLMNQNQRQSMSNWVTKGGAK